MTPLKAKENIDFDTEASIECSNDDYLSNLGNNTPRLLDETNSILNITGKRCYHDKVGEVPAPAPTRFKLAPKWRSILQIAKASTPFESAQLKKLILKKIKGPTEKPPPVKCCKIGLIAKFITDDEYLASIKEKE